MPSSNWKEWQAGLKVSTLFTRPSTTVRSIIILRYGARVEHPTRGARKLGL